MRRAISRILFATIAAAGADAARAADFRFGPSVADGGGVREISFTLAVDPTIAGDAALSVEALSDFSTVAGGLAIFVDGVKVGDLGVSSPLSAGGCRIGAATATIPEATLAPLIADGAISIRFTQAGAAGPCASAGAFIAPAAGAAFGVSGALSYESAAAEELAGADAAAEESETSDAEAESDAETVSYAETRASLALSKLPDLSQRLRSQRASTVTGGGTEASGSLNFFTSLAAMRREDAAKKGYQSAATKMLGASRRDLDVWVSGAYSYSGSALAGSESVSESTVLQIGADYRIGKNAVAGLFLSGDFVEQAPADSLQGEGEGFLVGPYAVIALAEKVRLEGLAAFGTATDAPDALADGASVSRTERFEFSSRLSGDWSYQDWTLTPSSRLTYYGEGRDFFDRVGAGVPLSEDAESQGEFTFGPTVRYDMTLESGSTVKPFASLEGALDFTPIDQTGATNSFSANSAFGLDADFGAASLTASGHCYGVGQGEAESSGGRGCASVSGNLQLKLPFN